MSSWADVKINGHILLSWSNSYDLWHFTKKDRVRDIVSKKYESGCETFIGYRTTVASLQRRLNLSGYNLKTAERDFNDTRSIWIEEMNSHLDYFQGCKEREGDELYSNLLSKISQQLEVVRTASFQDWLEALPKAIAEQDKYADMTALGDDVVIENEPLISLMLSELAGVSDRYLGFAGAIFPCMNVESYAIVLLKISNNNDCCELDISELIHGGWVDDFEDIAQVQASATIFYQHFEQSIVELSTLNNSTQSEALQRMIFASVITTMEAYLSDTMKKQVLNRHSIKRRFVEFHNSFDYKIRLNEIFSQLDRLDQKLNEEIDRISFHNVGIFTKLYNDVLLCEFPGEDIKELRKAINIRHDIVHRNGKSTNGKLVTVSQQDVVVLSELIKKIIKSIDLQIIDGLIDSTEE